MAAANFVWQLGSSSYYVDELLSVNVSLQPLSHLWHTVSVTEITPPGWFFLLHEWAGRLGSTRSEWVMRLPSMLCAVALVGVVYWLVRLLDGTRRLALGAGAVAALSPFALEYGQRAQGYAATALLAALAVAGALSAERTGALSADRRAERTPRWLVLSLLAAAGALLCSYTAALVVAPLCLWILVRGEWPLRWRAAYATVCTLVQASVIPLLLSQHRAHAQRGVGASGAFSASTLQNMLELPFGGRSPALRPLGVAVTVIGMTVALAAVIGARDARRGGASVRVGGAHPFDGRRLVVAVAVGAPLFLILATAVGGSFWGELMLNRYGTTAVPFIIVALALAVSAAPRWLGGPLVAGIAAVLVAGVIENHRPTSFYLDARHAAAYVDSHARPSDRVIEPAYPWYQVPLEYYGLARWRPLAAGAAPTTRLVASRSHRLWVVVDLPSGQPIDASRLIVLARQSASRYGYRALSLRVFPSISPLAVLLEAPKGVG